MTKWDKDYLELCKRILKEGEEVENRTGINTIKIPEFFIKDAGKTGKLRKFVSDETLDILIMHVPENFVIH